MASHLSLLLLITLSSVVSKTFWADVAEAASYCSNADRFLWPVRDLLARIIEVLLLTKVDVLHTWNLLLDFLNNHELNKPWNISNLFWVLNGTLRQIFLRHLVCSSSKLPVCASTSSSHAGPPFLLGDKEAVLQAKPE
ncbi:hypothetical protein DY000_02017758 [Brassica cretica]|uniref:Uncharacterized protein n=1 Tax=Brassica cretica TaxID=69181 RepID=A0ABQ7CTW0_BRACR|nr:hypothetical protein DY000_02017758 [Brassica cretica]